MINSVVFAPLNRVKVILQTEAVNYTVKPEQRLLSNYKVFYTILKTQGIQAFWRGNSIPFLLAIPYAMSNVYIYQPMKKKYNIKSEWFPTIAYSLNILKNISVLLLIGIFLYPAEIVSTQMMTDMGNSSGRQFKSLLDCFDKVSVKPIEMYRGIIFNSLSLEIINDMSQPFVSFFMKKYVINSTNQPDLALEFLVGVVFKCLIAGLTHPVETVVHRLFVQCGKPHRLFYGPLDCMWKTFKNEGYRAFYNGYLMRCVQIPVMSLLLNTHKYNWERMT
jgi:Mitochondrial carrier protein